MFDDQALEKYLSQHGVRSEGHAYIRRVRSSEPSRLVGSGARNVTCRFPSRKMGRTIQAESHSCELPAVWIWEFDSATHEFWDQPEATLLPIVTRNGRHTNQPKTADYLLLQDDFVGWVECKPLAWLQDQCDKGNPSYRRDDDGRWHYLPGEAAASRWGMGYVVRLAEDNNPALVDNLAFLADYLTGTGREVAAPARERILALLGGSGWIRLCELVRAPNVIADDVYALVARCELYVDLREDRLSEIERTFVFRDRDTATAFRLILRSSATRRAPDLSLVNLSPGSKLCWDGRVWTVANVGDGGYFLMNGRESAELPRDVMQRLIGDGKVLADPAAPSAQSERAAERLALANDAQRDQAVKRFQALFPELGAPRVDVPRRTLAAWRRAWREGLECYGNGFLGLLPNIHLRGNRLPKLPAQTLEIVHQVVQTRYLSEESPSMKACYGIARLQCQAAGAIVPSPTTFSRAVHQLTTQVESVRAREGAKAAYQVETWCWHLEPDTPKHGQHPLEVAHLDHTEIDLQLVDERFERKTRKCWVSALIDAYSRKVLATFVTYDAPSYRSCMMVLRNCVRRIGRVPATIVVDWGSDFRSVHFERLLAYLVVLKKHRPKGAPRHGAVVERLFKRMNEDFIHNLRGNNKGLQNPRSLSKSHDPRERAVWTIERFTERLDDYIEQVYARQPHETLGVSPQRAYELGLRDFGERADRRIAYDEAFRMICLPTTDKGTARVRPGGHLKINGLLYHSPPLAAPDMLGRDLDVRYDPFDMALAYAFVQGKWIELKSPYAAVFARYTEREIQAASQLIRDKQRGTYERRQVSADLIARYLLRVEQEEAALIADDTVRRAQRGAPNEILNGAGRADGLRNAVPTSDPFADLPTEQYGELE